MRTLARRLLAAALLAACGAAAGADDAPPPALAHARKLYDVYCVQCHGVNRDGNGVNSRDMAVKPRDHTDSKAMGDTPDDLLTKAIKGGGLAVGKSVLMPRWEGVMTDDEIAQMVAYLRFVSKTTPK